MKLKDFGGLFVMDDDNGKEEADAVLIDSPPHLPRCNVTIISELKLLN